MLFMSDLLKVKTEALFFNHCKCFVYSKPLEMVHTLALLYWLSSVHRTGCMKDLLTPNSPTSGSYPMDLALHLDLSWTGNMFLVCIQSFYGFASSYLFSGSEIRNNLYQPTLYPRLFAFLAANQF